jgi:hypothetical protein
MVDVTTVLLEHFPADFRNQIGKFGMWRILKFVSRMSYRFGRRKYLMVYMALHSNATALLEAVEQGNYAIVKLLLEHGADPNAKSQMGFTPLQRARDLGCPLIVKALEKKPTAL